MLRSARKSFPARGRAFALWTLLAALALQLAGSCADEPERRPDVILLVVDTLRADRLGSYGCPRPTTPRLDLLAAQGTRFADVTAQSSWTLPSMVSLFSGRYLSDYRDFPDPGAPALAEAFQSAGYRTLGVVANVLLREEAGFNRGFEHYDARAGSNAPGVERVRARSIGELEADLWPALDGMLAGAGAERAPFFVYLHPFDPHHPYGGDPALDAELPPGESPAVSPVGWQEQALQALGPRPPAGERDWSRELAELRRQRGLYDQDVRLTDAGIGRILDGLEARGLLENAVVALVSDHGECLFERLGPMPREKLRQAPPATFFYQDHGAYLYEEALRTPFLLWGAGVPAGKVVAQAVENVDLFPTLLELCQVPARGELHGRSLVPLLAGKPAEAWRDSVHAHVLFSTSVRDLESGAKLIVPTAHGERVGVATELLDLARDPRELAPLDDRATRERMLARLEAWRRRYPTESTFGQRPDETTLQMLNDLGYTETHVGY